MYRLTIQPDDGAATIADFHQNVDAWIAAIAYVDSHPGTGDQWDRGYLTAMSDLRGTGTAHVLTAEVSVELMSS